MPYINDPIVCQRDKIQFTSLLHEVLKETSFKGFVSTFCKVQKEAEVTRI